MMEKIVFNNGFTVALIPKTEAHSAAVSFFIGAGNRFETVKTSGISHFVEHMVFKGTETRLAVQISEEADLMGGQLNAYTAKEYTCFYSRALSEHLGRTLHLICDMICNPSFLPEELETEKGVVLEEIGMYEDSPEEFCADMLTALCYKDNPLGFNILGTRDTVSEFTADDLRRYMERVYVPERMVVTVCGKFDRSEVLEILEGYFGEKKNTGNFITAENMKINSGYSLFTKKLEQTQIAFCYNGLPSGHELRHAASFFSSIAGGAASSRINRRIREELGLAYSVYTFSSSYLGTGMFGIQAGLAHKNQERFLSEVLKELNAVKRDVTREEVERTRQQFKAGLALSNESMAAVASSCGRQLLFEGKYNDLDTLLKAVDEVTIDDVKRVGNLITDSGNGVAVSVVGSAEGKSFYERYF
jgi:predicted Zn-dependent peptidase